MTLNHRFVYPLIALVGIGCIVGLWLADPAVSLVLAEEDGPIETLSAALWATGVVCCVVAVRRRAFAPYNLLWLVICLASLGEETSWFQRYLGYSVPAVEQVSRQAEFNIHNLEVFPYSVSQLLYIIGLATWFLVLPLALTHPSVRAVAARLRYPDPTITFALSMWGAVAVSYLPTAEPEVVRHAVRETREMLYSAFVLVYVFGLAVRRVGLFRTWPPFVTSTASAVERPGVASA